MFAQLKCIQAYGARRPRRENVHRWRTGGSVAEQGKVDRLPKASMSWFSGTASQRGGNDSLFHCHSLHSTTCVETLHQNKVKRCRQLRKNCNFDPNFLPYLNPRLNLLDFVVACMAVAGQKKKRKRDIISKRPSGQNKNRQRDTQNKPNGTKTQT